MFQMIAQNIFLRLMQDGLRYPSMLSYDLVKLRLSPLNANLGGELLRNSDWADWLTSLSAISEKENTLYTVEKGLLVIT